MNTTGSSRPGGLPAGPMVAEGIEFISPALAEALVYWNAIKGDVRFPRRADMEPEHIVALWPYILMVDVIGDGDYFVRLFGQALVDAYGEQTGRRDSESTVDKIVRERSKVLFDHCVSQAKPSYAYWPVTGSRGRVLFDVEALCLPLLSDGVKLDRLMSLNVNSRKELRPRS